MVGTLLSFQSLAADGDWKQHVNVFSQVVAKERAAHPWIDALYELAIQTKHPDLLEVAMRFRENKIPCSTSVQKVEGEPTLFIAPLENQSGAEPFLFCFIERNESPETSTLFGFEDPMDLDRSQKFEQGLLLTIRDADVSPLWKGIILARAVFFMNHMKNVEVSENGPQSDKIFHERYARNKLLQFQFQDEILSAVGKKPYHDLKRKYVDRYGKHPHACRLDRAQQDGFSLISDGWKRDLDRIFGRSRSLIEDQQRITTLWTIVQMEICDRKKENGALEFFKAHFAPALSS